MQYLFLLLKHWQLVLLTSVLGALSGLLLSAVLPPIFEAEAQVAVVRQGAELNLDPKFKTISELDPARSSIDLTARRRALTTLALGSGIASSVAPKLGGRLSEAERLPANLARAIEARADGDLIKIRAKADTAEKAALIANAWAQEYERLVNTIYAGNPFAPGELQSQADAAKRDYDQKESHVIAYLGDSPIEQLTRQINEKSQVLSDTSKIKVKLEHLLADAQALRERYVASTGNTRGDELAALLLEASAFSTFSDLPVDFQIPIEQLITNATREEQLRNLDTLIAALEARRKTVESDTINQAQRELSGLQAQLEQEQAKKDELTRARDLAWTTYTTLMTKVAEVQVAAQTQVTVVRFAAPAVAPQEPVAPKLWLLVVLGTAVGFVLGVACVFVLEGLAGFARAKPVPMSGRAAPVSASSDLPQSNPARVDSSSPTP